MKRPPASSPPCGADIIDARLSRVSAPRGFTLIEVMVVIAIIAILAMMAVPNMQDKLVRDQIVEAAKWAEFAKAPVAASWAASKTLPTDNTAAGLPAPEKIVSNLVSAVTIESGVLHITFGNQVNGAIKGKTLSLRPAVVPDSQVVPVAWVCAKARAPTNMTVQGSDRTDLPDKFLPFNCR
jgi:type IV pilus assembly protein PilA